MEAQPPPPPDPQAISDKLGTWLDQKWAGQKTCPVCDANKWQAPDDLVEIRPYHGGGLVVGGAVYPAAQVICGNCGYTLLFNALLAGLIEQPVEPEGDKPESS